MSGNHSAKAFGYRVISGFGSRNTHFNGIKMKALRSNEKKLFESLKTLINIK